LSEQVWDLGKLSPRMEALSGHLFRSGKIGSIEVKLEDLSKISFEINISSIEFED
jgi:hypothetical protein